MQNNQQKNSEKKKLRPGQMTRPKNLNLFTIRLPINALVSILHRASGCLLFLILPLLLLLVQLSLSSAEHYQTVVDILHSPFIKLMLLGLAWAFFHHFFCGYSSPCNGRALDDNTDEGSLYQQSGVGDGCACNFGISN